MSRDSCATLASPPLTSINNDKGGGNIATATLFSASRHEQCPNAQGWLRGRCVHGNERWVRLSCKRRDCPVCGEIRRRKISYRIQFGLEILGDGAWFVGTWDYDVPKKEAVKTQNKFIRWLRRDIGIDVQYAATWELHKSGRLHLNLILSPWTYINQRTLSQKWSAFGGGPVVWIERVDGGISNEVTKLRYKLGNYMAKFEQQVKEGRGINYSKGWPKIPSNPLQRMGEITWVWLRSDYPEAEELEQSIDLGFYSEIAPGEYSLCGEVESCNCFHYSLTPHKPRDKCC